MARWVRVLAVGGGAGTTTWVASTGGFLLVMTCVLAVAALVAASCAIHLHFHRRDDKNNSNCSARPAESFKVVPMSPGRKLLSNSKKVLISKKWRQSDHQESEPEACDRETKKEEADGEDNSLWQRRILMGERCEPPDFSGRIIYDHKGNRLSEFPPRSPKLNLFQPNSLSDLFQQP